MACHIQSELESLFFTGDLPPEPRLVITPETAQQMYRAAVDSGGIFSCAVDAFSTVISIAMSPDCARPSDAVLSEAVYALRNLNEMVGICRKIEREALGHIPEGTANSGKAMGAS